jgi:hypothetical protein
MLEAKVKSAFFIWICLFRTLELTTFIKTYISSYISNKEYDQISINYYMWQF